MINDMINDMAVSSLFCLQCSSIHLYNTKEDMCTFVTITSDCTADVKFFNYMDFVYCKLGSAKWFAITLLVSMKYCTYLLAYCTCSRSLPDPREMTI